jgi:hypothetical protein
VACTKSSIPGNWEFVVHFKDEYDYRFICENRDEMFESLKAVYFLQMNTNLPIYAVSEKHLKSWATSKKEAKEGKDKTPPQDKRLFDEDVYEPVDDPARMTQASYDRSTTWENFDDEGIPGEGDFKPTFTKDNDNAAKLSDFVIKKVIGRGSFGKVFLV